MQVKSWKYMLQTSENYKLQQHSRASKKKKNLEDISQYKLLNRICHLTYGEYNLQPTVCR